MINIEVWPINEFINESGYDYEDICTKKGGKLVFFSTDAEGDPVSEFTGVQYEDGTYTVVGVRTEKEVSCAQMIKFMLANAF